jgi:hypothetical protein
VEFHLKNEELTINGVTFDFRTGKAISGQITRSELAANIVAFVDDLKFSLNRLILRRKMRLPKNTLTMLKSLPKRKVAWV